jgi:hypothetical protein
MSIAKPISSRADAGGRGNESHAPHEQRPTLLRLICERFGLLALLTYCLAGAAIVTVKSADLIHNRWENTYPESAHVYVALQSARTGRLYSSFSQPPYVLQSYGPFYYEINMWIEKVSHLDFDRSLLLAREVSFGCYLLSAAMVFLICKALDLGAANGALAGLMLLGQPAFFTWNVTARSDMLLLAAMLTSIYLALCDRTSVKSLVASGMLGGAALLIKQPGIAVIAAVGGVLLLRKRWKEAAYFAAGVAVPVLLMFGALLWRREPFWDQYVIVGKGLWSPAEGAVFAISFLRKITVITPLVIGGVGAASALGAGEGPQMVVAFMVINWCFALAGMPQIGSNINYFLPGLAGCALLLPYAIQWARENLRRASVFVAIALGLLWTTYAVARTPVIYGPVQEYSVGSYQGLQSLRIFSDRPIFSVHGRDPEFLDAFAIHSLELTGHWDSASVVQSIARGDYDLVILACMGTSHEVCNWRGVAYFDAPMVAAINSNYAVMCSTLSSRVLKPRVREIAATPATLAPALGQPCGTGLQGRSPDLVIPQGIR